VCSALGEPDLVCDDDDMSDADVPALAADDGRLRWLAVLPRPADKPVQLRCKPAAVRHLEQGHPWLFDEAITHASRDAGMGDLAVLNDEGRTVVALGLFDPRSPIRVKVLHRGKPTPIDDAFFARRIADALARRAPLLATDTDGVRLVHGDNDGLPGFVVDQYDDTLVIKLYSACWVPRLHQLVPPLVASTRPTRIVLRLSRGVARHPEDLHGLRDGVVVAGPPLSGPVLFREHGLVFSADPLVGQKTGFFLDQRDNRARVEALSRGKRVLNVFSYSGGFSLAAARGGATSVTSVDLSRPALDDCVRHFALNQHHASVAACAHEELCGDAFVILEQLRDAGRRFDVVVIDPPSFAKSAAEIDGARTAYARLCALGLGVVADDGLLVLASCSSRITPAQFRETMRRAAERAGSDLGIVEETGHAVDHPVGFAEGRYLKCLFCRPRRR
jgi:23S rRNA (cytosine1962-C5)-methyltransferase